MRNIVKIASFKLVMFLCIFNTTAHNKFNDTKKQVLVDSYSISLDYNTGSLLGNSEDNLLESYSQLYSNVAKFIPKTVFFVQDFQKTVCVKQFKSSCLTLDKPPPTILNFLQRYYS